MGSHKHMVVLVTLLALLVVAHGASLDELLHNLAGTHQQQLESTKFVGAAWQFDRGRLDLRKWSLSGPILPWFGNLTLLNAIHLHTNSLDGSIPPELGNLYGLTVLDLSNNRLSGSISEELGNLYRLTVLDLSNNCLSGSIPKELGKLQRLSSLTLQGNQLSGTVPFKLLWNLSHLR
jgi:Leucine-rich repeat (LRR) protein